MANLHHLNPNLFSNNTTTTNTQSDLVPYDHYNEPWEAPWDTKAAILLGQGIFITIMVAAVLCACGRKHARRMSLLRLQELTTIRIETSSSRDGANEEGVVNETTSQDNEERSRLQRIRQTLLSPLRYIDAMVNSWSASPSTDFEYYDRILARMEREKEARREGAEERTKRLMNAFLKGQCVWEIEDKHFIPPCSTKDIESDDDLDDSISNVIDSEVDIENGLKAQIDNVYTAFNEKLKGMVVAAEGDEENNSTIIGHDSDRELTTDNVENSQDDELERSVEENCCNESDSDENKHAEDSETFTNSKDADIKDGAATANRTRQLSGSVSFDSSTPSYLYLNISQNRTRANSTGSTPTIKTSMATSSSEPSLPSTTNIQRAIPNQCAICLCDYTKGDTVVLSSNKSCPHAFHQECIVEWLVKMQEGTPCPCCRQTFIELENNQESIRRTRGREMSEEELGALRRHLQLGLQRGRAFNASVIRF